MLATILQRDIRNPRIGRVSIMAVELAKIFVTFDEIENKKRIECGLQGLRETKNFLRLRLGKLLQLWVVPDLHFYNDYSILQGYKIDKLLHLIAQNKQV